jgi:hypothetical protein
LGPASRASHRADQMPHSRILSNSSTLCEKSRRAASTG